MEQGCEVSSTATMLSQGYKILEYPGAPPPKACVAFEPWTDWILIIYLWWVTECGGTGWVLLGALHSALTAEDFLPHSANHKSVLLLLAAVEVPNSQGRK